MVAQTLYGQSFVSSSFSSLTSSSQFSSSLGSFKSARFTPVQTTLEKHSSPTGAKRSLEPLQPPTATTATAYPAQALTDTLHPTVVTLRPRIVPCEEDRLLKSDQLEIILAIRLKAFSN